MARTPSFTDDGSVNARLSSHDAQIADHTEQLAAHDERIREARVDLDRLDSVDRGVTALAHGHREMAADAGATKADVATLRDDVAQLNGNVSRLSKLVERVQALALAPLVFMGTDAAGAPTSATITSTLVVVVLGLLAPDLLARVTNRAAIDQAQPSTSERKPGRRP